ncbi:MAG: hypothetical protein ACI9DM_000238 [Cyclobacteriaceae bacterium]|jgi:hypothetical protein
MTTKEANSIVVKLYNEFKKDQAAPKEDSVSRREKLIVKCTQAHHVGGFYEVLTNKNALKMASMASTMRFVQPWQMLLKLQIHLESS